MQIDILAFGAHPDDVELGCSGTLLLHKEKGKSIGIIDLTSGELGTRGSAQLRMEEAAAAAKAMGLDIRETLDMPDGFIENNAENRLKVVTMLRKYRPGLVLCNALYDRHTDHGKAGALVAEACFIAGLAKIETTNAGQAQLPWRPKVVLHYIQDYYIKPDVVVDITPKFQAKIEIVKAYKSQFYSQESVEPETPISVPHFFDYLQGRALDMGRYAGVKYAEGFTASRPLGVEDLTALF